MDMAMDLQELRRARYVFERLNKIARTVRKINENDCNYQISKGQETRRNNLEAKAEELVKDLNVDWRIYCQRDPRGCSLYILDSTIDDNNYSDGVCLF
jgi:hypothetical protein